MTFILSAVFITAGALFIGAARSGVNIGLYVRNLLREPKRGKETNVGRSGGTW